MKALFDTNATVYWMAGAPRFQLPLKQLVNELRAQRASLFLSTVSLQEILVFSRPRGTADDDHAFLLERFNRLPFDEPCALTAARLAALVGSPRRPDRRKAGPVSDLAVDIWHRDAAIAGTAEQYGMELLVTCDRGLVDDFKPHMGCAVRLIEGHTTKGEAPPEPPSSTHTQPLRKMLITVTGGRGRAARFAEEPVRRVSTLRAGRCHSRPHTSALHSIPPTCGRLRRALSAGVWRGGRRFP